MKHDIFNGAGISAQIAKGMALAFFARAFEELAGHLAPHGGAKLPEVIDPAAEHAAFTLACDLRIKNDATDLAQLYERARVAHRTGEGFADMTPAQFGAYLALRSMTGGDVLTEAFGPHVAALFDVPYVEFGAHSLEFDYSTPDY
jgi:hypothetical protein